MVTVEKIAYRGWNHCYRVTDGTVEAVVTSDVGPRVIRCGFNGGPNCLGEMEEQMGLTGGDEWRMYGGHRLWHSPEALPRTYIPDNEPVEVIQIPDGVELRQKAEPGTGIAKSVRLTLDAGNHQFTVGHRLVNQGLWPVTLAPWAITVMRTGGVAIFPQIREALNGPLLFNRVLALWPYTDMNDSRVIWGSRYILLRQDVTKEKPFKLGISAPEGWMAYLNDGFLFVKRHLYQTGAVYPDGGVNIETYTNHAFLELESLGPLQTLEPGNAAELTEVWSLFKNIGPVNGEEDVEKNILPYIQG